MRIELGYSEKCGEKKLLKLLTGTELVKLKKGKVDVKLDYPLNLGCVERVVGGRKGCDAWVPANTCSLVKQAVGGMTDWLNVTPPAPPSHHHHRHHHHHHHCCSCCCCPPYCYATTHTQPLPPPAL